MKIFKIVSLFLAAAIVATGAINVSVNAAGNKPNFAEGQILVKFKSGTAEESSKKALNEAGGKKKLTLNKLDVTVVDVTKGKEQQAVEKLSKNKDVEFAELDSLSYVLSADPGFNNQWGLANVAQPINGIAGTNDADIDAPEAWAVTTGIGVKVAVLDTGIDQDHEDISSKIVGQANFTTSPSADDLYGHGTHVAGIIAAQTDNAIGVAGVCPGCTLLNGKVLSDNGSGATSWIANGITWAADSGAKVINLSLGSSQPSKTMESAVNYAWSKGSVVVAAAGNSGTSSKHYPAAYTNAIAVASTDNKDKKSSFSTYGFSWVDVAAPGSGIYSTTPNNASLMNSQSGTPLNYAYLNGTSMASPMVAGTVALVWSTPFGTTNTAVRNRVQSKADIISGTGIYWAKGRVNAARAVTP